MRLRSAPPPPLSQLPFRGVRREVPASFLATGSFFRDRTHLFPASELAQGLDLSASSRLISPSGSAPMPAKRSPCVLPLVALLLLGETSGARGRGWLSGSGAGIAGAFGALLG